MYLTVDTALLTWMNQHYLPGSIPVLQFISASTTYVSIGMILITLLAAIYKKSAPLRRKFFMLAVVLLLSAILSPALKSVIYRERPFYTHTHIEKRAAGGESSFPSGHALEAFAMALTVSLCFRKRSLTIAVFIWALLVGYSRIALGVHYPSDVLGGMLIGMGMALLVVWLSGKLKALPREPSEKGERF